MIVFLYVILFVAVASGKDSKCQRSPKPDISFVVTVCEEKTFQCMASLILPNTIFTVAHCFKIIVVSLTRKTITSIAPRVLAEQKSCDSPISDDPTVSEYRNHKYFRRYDSNRQINPTYDVSYALLKKPFLINAKIQPMKPIAADRKGFSKSWKNVLDSGKTCVIVSWTLESPGQPTNKKSSPSIKYTRVTPFSKNCKGKENCLEPVSKNDRLVFNHSGAPLICDGFSFGFYQGFYYNFIFYQDHDYLTKFFKLGKSIKSDGRICSLPSLVLIITLALTQF